MLHVPKSAKQRSNSADVGRGQFPHLDSYVAGVALSEHVARRRVITGAGSYRAASAMLRKP